MGRDRFTNAVPSTLSGTINSSVTTVGVNDASTWPSGNFRVVCENEIMYCTSRSSNTLTVIRAFENSSAASHASGKDINHIATAGVFADALRHMVMADYGCIAQEASLSADDDDFDDETVDGSWAEVQSGTSNDYTKVERNHRMSFNFPSGGNNQEIRSLVKAKTPSAGDWVQAGYQFMGGYEYNMLGLVMANGATWNSGRQVFFAMSYRESQLFLREFTGYNLWNQSTNFGFGSCFRPPNSQYHFRLVWNSANNYNCLVSPDGYNWALANAGGTSCGTVGTVTHMGMSFSTWGSTPGMPVSATYCRFSF